MKTLLVLIVGLALGFGGGILFSSRHPDQAADIANKEEVHILDAKIAWVKVHKAALDKAIANKATPDPALVEQDKTVADELAKLEADRAAKS